MSVADFVGTLLTSERLIHQITEHRVLKGCDPVYAETKRPWSQAIQTLLQARSIQLFSHQALATDYIRSGRSVVVSTATASGKSLIYTLPVLEECLLDREAHALYLFPLKALAQDQLATFKKMTEAWPEEVRPTAALYDGDTPENQRRAIRKNIPSVLITNPEMLHLAILPWHSQWTVFLAGLRYIVIDEAHTYRGVFGSNMAMLFRRLNRLVRRYGRRPTYILCTATVGNPGELAAKLIDADPTDEPVIIDKSGAPQGDRHYIFVNPTLAPSSTAIDLLQLAMQKGLRTIVYCRSRKMTELISLWANSAAPPAYKHLISAYRAGYLPEERRDIEARMASGQLRCVVSTSALELGIDIGGLDVCILVGYPGSIMATLQRGGRVGRARQESCVVLLAGEDALDQYFINNPEDFFNRSPEKAVINPDNEVIAARHLVCAAAETPLSPREPWIQSEGMQRSIQSLLTEGSLLFTEDGQHLAATVKNPQRAVSLRSGGANCIIENQDGTIIGSIDLIRAWHEAYPGAVYLHHGKSYIVQALDSAKGLIKACEQRVNWFTRVRSQKTTVILEEKERLGLGRSFVSRGRLRITDTVTGYEKRSTNGNILLDIVPLSLPPCVFETEGIWFVIPEAIRLLLEENFFHFMGSIHACEHAMIGLLPLRVMADRNDFGGISTPLHPQVGASCIFVYDGIPGGAGLTREAFTEARAVLADTLKGIAGCPCSDGCPSCVHSPKCGSGNRPISKDGAIYLLDTLLQPGHEGDILAQKLVLTPAKALPGGQKIDYSGKDLSHPEPVQADFCTRASSGKTGTPPNRYVVFDVETRLSADEVGGWSHADKMGVSIAIAFDSGSNRFLRFEQEALSGLFELFQQADLVIGYNSLRFDYCVLAPFAPYPLQKLPSLDLLSVIKNTLHYRLSLDSVAKATLGAPKSASGLQALAWWKEGKLEDIARYCEQDVRLTRDLYLFGLEKGHLFFTTKSRQTVRIPVDFTLPCPA